MVTGNRRGANRRPISYEPPPGIAAAGGPGPVATLVPIADPFPQTGAPLPSRPDDADPDDAALVEQARGGDREALEVLLRRHYDRIHAVCRRITGNPADAADAAQNALIAVTRGLARFDSRSRFSSWTYRIAVNCSLDELRRRARSPAVTLDDPDWTTGSALTSHGDAGIGGDPGGHRPGPGAAAGAVSGPGGAAGHVRPRLRRDRRGAPAAARHGPFPDRPRPGRAGPPAGAIRERAVNAAGHLDDTRLSALLDGEGAASDVDHAAECPDCGHRLAVWQEARRLVATPAGAGAARPSATPPWPRPWPRRRRVLRPGRPVR